MKSELLVALEKELDILWEEQEKFRHTNSYPTTPVEYAAAGSRYAVKRISKVLQQY